MKRYACLLAIGAALMAPSPQAGWAAAPGSSEAVVENAMKALNQGRVDTFVKAIHPDSLEQYRAGVVGLVEVATKQGKEAEVIANFQGVANAEELRSLDATRLFAAMLGKVTSTPEVKAAMASAQIDVVGHLFVGTDRAYVVYRSKTKLGELDINRLNVASLLKSGTDWKMTIPDDLSAQLAAIRQGLVGKFPPPEFFTPKVEPLGHFNVGKRTAMVVYRLSTPVGDSTITRLGALSVSEDDPAWEAVRKDDTAAVTELIESSLGIPKPQAARKAVAPEVLAAHKAAAAKMLEDVRAHAARAQAKALNRPPLRPFPKDRPSLRPFPDAPESEIPEGLEGLPASFFGGDRDLFHDIAPEGGVLVGARVSYIMRFGGPKISSIVPVYRVGEKLVNGKRHGGLLGRETTAIARPGYAVGALNTHTGLTVDGFEMLFMRIDGDRLDSSDSYTSPWLGDRKGGVPRDVSSDGRIPVGLHGRAEKEVNALGLIVKTGP